MAQLLIVEGNTDSRALSELLRLRNVPHPKGVDINNFIKPSDSFEKTIDALGMAIGNQYYTNIGLVVDANGVGPLARLDKIRDKLGPKYSDFLKGPPESTGLVFSHEGLTVGIWIMPDNLSKGYLEHFLARLIPNDDKLWNHAEDVVKNLPVKNFTEVKTQKANIHTWLAWQKKPGQPFGIALKAKSLDARSPAADHFESWFRQTFQFED